MKAIKGWSVITFKDDEDIRRYDIIPTEVVGGVVCGYYNGQKVVWHTPYEECVCESEMECHNRFKQQDQQEIVI